VQDENDEGGCVLLERIKKQQTTKLKIKPTSESEKLNKENDRESIVAEGKESHHNEN
jgi:hypothetical protein